MLSLRSHELCVSIDSTVVMFNQIITCEILESSPYLAVNKSRGGRIEGKSRYSRLDLIFDHFETSINS